MHFSIVHMLVSSLIHGLVYAVIFKAMRHLSLPEAIVVAVVGVALVGFGYKAFLRWQDNRPRRGGQEARR